MNKQITNQDLLLVELGSLTPGKPFAGFAAGSFVDMNGREVEFKPSRVKEFLKNTLKAIRDARAKGMPGLPIDARQHDKGDAAGWIVDASEGEVEDSEGNRVSVIMLAAEWTKLGIELLTEKILANFSPTVDLRNSVIRGGSLTNWPASVDKFGVPLFPAVELSDGGSYRMLAISYDATSMHVRQSWARQQGESDTWVIEVFNEYVIASVGETRFRIGYTIEGEEATFAPREEWVEVSQQWVEASEGAEEIDHREEESESNESEVQEADLTTGDIDMNLTKEELSVVVSEQVRDALKAELQALIPPATNTGEGDDSEAPTFDVLKFLEMSNAGDEVVASFKQAMLDQWEAMRGRAALEANEMIARIRRDADITEFSQLVTGGSTDIPYGLPVGVEELKQFLSHLQPDDLAFAKKLLSDFQQHGRQKFTELGHGKRVEGGSPLPDAYARALDRGELTLAGLTAPELMLGDLGQYDLSRWSNGNGGK